MSQFKFNVDNAQYPLDAFATVTVDSNAGFVVGELVTASGNSATAKVSRLISTTGIVVKAVKGGLTMTGNLTSPAQTTPTAISGFAWGQPRTRDVDGTPTSKMFGVIAGVDDRGIIFKTREDDHAEVSVSARLALSKIQDTDTTVGPTLVYGLPAAKTYADGEVLRFTITSNEALSVTGAPQVAILNAGSSVTTHATLNLDLSTSMFLVFDYTNDEDVSAAGQIVSALYDANGAVITDIGGGPVVPSTFGTVTGIILA
jgi:hypothetical protein